jgi:hypothetical protein
MFAKIQQFRPMGPRRAVAGANAPAHSNDNRIAACGVAAPRRSRPVLACRWRSGAGGRLECHWDIEIATDEPDQRWMIGRLGRLLGIATAGARLALPAVA